MDIIERVATWLVDHFGPHDCPRCHNKFHRKARSEPRICNCRADYLNECPECYAPMVLTGGEWICPAHQCQWAWQDSAIERA